MDFGKNIKGDLLEQLLEKLSSQDGMNLKPKEMVAVKTEEMPGEEMVTEESDEMGEDDLKKLLSLYMES